MILSPQHDFHYSDLNRVHEMQSEVAKKGQCHHPWVTAACIALYLYF